VDTLIRPAAPTFFQALLYWLKLGFISFGGPAGQIALMHQELVEKRRWISEGRFLHALNYCMLLPGPEAQQLAIYLGWLLHRRWGGIAAGVLFVLPSFLILSALTWGYLRFGHLPAVSGLFAGLKPAIVAIVFYAAWRIGRRTLRNPWLVAIALLAFGAIFLLRLPFPWIVSGAALLGVLGGWLRPGAFAGASHAALRTGNAAASAPALIDDDTPPPPHATFSWAGLTRLLLAGALFGGLVWMLLPQGVLRDMAEFFTRAAFLTFGGAYAVLPYVYQGAVEQFQWLTGPQMMDGLALGETTPGPLIMVVGFVGFIGGWNGPLFGIASPLLAGLAGAGVATFFTFLPSFLFIFAGAPLIERSRGALHFTAPLTAITAAVVGVIVNLGVFFAWHAIWPRATPDAVFSGGLNGLAVLLTGLALLLLLRWRRGMVEVMAMCAVAGLLAQWAGWV
jgi:chromate transporter